MNKMLSPTASAHAPASSNNHDDNKSSSYFQSTVCLYDWWLIKSDEIFEGKRLAVAGFPYRELQAMRVFTSAPIVKRLDIFTLESADGICIILRGFINKSHTMENGFSDEVFSHFLFGFPPFWEAYNENCLEEEFTTGPSLATIPDTNGSATGHDAVAGMKNTNPNTTPINYEVNGKNKHNVEDINEGSPERMVNSKSCDEGSKGTALKSKTLEPASLESLTISKAALVECPIAKASNVENLNSSNLDPAMPVGDSSLELIITSTNSKTQDPSCLESTISNAELGECPIPKASNVENLYSSNLDPAVPMGDSGLDLRITSRKSKTQEPACLESISIANAASGECSISKASDIEYLKSSNLDPAVPMGNPGVNLGITSSRPKNSEQQDENGVTCGNKDCSTFSLPQEFFATVRCTGEKPSGVEGSSLSGFGLGVMHTPSLSTSPIYEDPNYQKPSGNCVDDTMNFPTVESDINVNDFTPTKVHTNALNVTPSNSGSRKTRSQNKRSGYTGSVKSKNKELMPKISEHSDGENLKRCSSGTAIHSGKKKDIVEAARSQSIKKMVRNMNGNSNGKKNERHTVVLAMKSKRNKMGSVGSATLVSDGTSNLEGMNKFDFCDDELQQPTHDNVVKDNSKKGKDHRKESQAAMPRQKPSNSDRSRNEFSDTNHQCESEAAVGEREATAKGDSAKKKARRKINFDIQASPPTQGRKENIVSPESLSLKRSRSGRLLLPSLDFWRNQIAVYDSDRKITGIQVARPSKGSKSEPPKKRSR
ncbi:hypothetical protein Dsin_006284 [Dipteronia sinensis]|uniref:SANTA domain-containing protein n=1 Tax=Dipteronia sinensis TaxID=43782 RepID=A0AAE0AZA5_9ROSI|nr:hypothetical protein Dsin_006284 [Dipteronia sinensis]